MQFTVRHVTRFTYDSPITESVMEARMEPRSEAAQRCLHFGLSTFPASRVMMYQDHAGNIVHHFNIPGEHAQLTVTAEALIDCAPPAAIPALDGEAWKSLDSYAATGEFWELLNPSAFTAPSPLLDDLSGEIGLDRGLDPLSLARRLMSEMFVRFEYNQEATQVDSPIDDALQSRRGVCQDFAHIMIALMRRAGVPCRYVSGYLFHHADSGDRSADGATHAWVEALMPDFGWVGFDPTNNLLATDRHIRVAIGRDYADVPPTRGVYKGVSAVRSELAVAVRVGAARPSVSGEALPFVPWMSRDAAGPLSESTDGGSQQ
jgi:transglutaminase-like putative cysteine protease